MKYIIGIDLGGSKIEGVLVNEKGKLFQEYSHPTQAFKPKQKILENIFRVISRLKTQKIYGIGIGIPGAAEEGVIKLMPNIRRLLQVNLKKALTNKFNCAVKIENDANCFALAESKLGAGRMVRNMLGIILGTGVGGGIIINKRLYHGKGYAGEIGHMIIDPKGIKCSCGNQGDLESWCSGPNIVKRYKMAKGSIKHPSPWQIFDSRERIAQKIVDQTLEKLSLGLANLTNILDPELIVLGGGLSNLNIYKGLNKRFRRYVKRKADLPEIVKNKLGSSSGVLGAAFLHT